MRITIEMGKKHNNKELDKLLSSIKDFKLTPIKVSIGGVDNNFIMEQYYSGYTGNVTVVLTESIPAKSEEQLAAENTVDKAKEALKAAEESLKLVSGSIN